MKSSHSITRADFIHMCAVVLKWGLKELLCIKMEADNIIYGGFN